MNEKVVNTILFLVILIGVIVAGFYIWQHYYPKKNNPAAANNQQTTTFQTQSGITVTSPKANEAIVSGLKITGTINGDGWTGFEGQVGTVKVLDKDGKELATTYLAATTPWTQLPVNFEATVTFNATAGSAGFLVFKNENASGDPVKDKTFILPITFK